VTEIAAAARAAGIVDGATGVARPLAERLATRAHAVIGSAVDGAPLVATARRVAVARAAELAKGLALAQQATGAKRAIVAVSARAPEVIAAMAKQCVEVTTIADLAAANDARELSRTVLGKDDGALVVDATSLVALAAGAPAVDAWVTIAGQVARPAVRRVAIGTTIADLVEATGGATCGPAWVALDGGPLAARPLDRDAVVTRATRAITILAGDSDLVRRARMPLGDLVRRALSACERCAMCSTHCAAGVAPHRLLHALHGAEVPGPAIAAALRCTGCGVCDTACPVGLSPRALVLAAGRALADRGVSREDAMAPDRAHEPLALSVIARRLGVSDGDEPPYDPVRVAPARVTIPCKHSLGVASTPRVKAGDRVQRGALIADLPADALGVPIHASIDGVVEEIDSYGISIGAK
jgi:Na+-translocating ferredoxin:NAD+ oxidoreductase RnfC subunit